MFILKYNIQNLQNVSQYVFWTLLCGANVKQLAHVPPLTIAANDSTGDLAALDFSMTSDGRRFHSFTVFGMKLALRVSVLE